MKKPTINTETRELALQCVYCETEWTTRRHLQGLQLKCPNCNKVNEVEVSEWLPELRAAAKAAQEGDK